MLDVAMAAREIGFHLGPLSAARPYVPRRAGLRVSILSGSLAREAVTQRLAVTFKAGVVECKALAVVVADVFESGPVLQVAFPAVGGEGCMGH
jgi:hypothetical protein